MGLVTINSDGIATSIPLEEAEVRMQLAQSPQTTAKLVSMERNCRELEQQLSTTKSRKDELQQELSRLTSRRSLGSVSPYRTPTKTSPSPSTPSVKRRSILLACISPQSEMDGKAHSGRGDP
eukprot:scaffold2740_cov418-Prasinococcus_capsulatus_cf.AAC.11